VLRKILGVFRNGESGQDLAEYCLLTALLSLIGLGLFIHFSGGVHAIWSQANSTLAHQESGPSTGGSGVAASSSSGSSR
jgi:Flp pilus assembly pilin Flp